MTDTTDKKLGQERIFGNRSMGNVAVSLLGLAFFAPEAEADQSSEKNETDDFTFLAGAGDMPDTTDQQVDLIDIVPAMASHYSSTAYQLGVTDIRVANDGTVYQHSQAVEIEPDAAAVQETPLIADVSDEPA